ncbi:MAG: hypothetical protein ACTMKU_06670 [Actinomycetaceae bacterium]
MSTATAAAQKENAELSQLQERGRELGASFLPPTERQGVAIRTILLASTDTSREPSSEA